MQLVALLVWPVRFLTSDHSLNKTYCASWTSASKFVVLIFAGGLLLSGLISFRDSGLTIIGFLARYVFSSTAFLVLWTAILKGRYIRISDNELVDVNSWIEKERAPINRIHTIRAGRIFGFVPVIDVIFELDSAKISVLRIGPALFRKQVLKELLHDLKQLKTDIIVDDDVGTLVDKLG